MGVQELLDNVKSRRTTKRNLDKKQQHLNTKGHLGTAISMIIFGETMINMKIKIFRMTKVLS